jgi:hypothetical protein
MGQVFVIWFSGYHDCEPYIHAIKSTREKAEAEMKEIKNDCDYYEILEYDLD